MSSSRSLVCTALTLLAGAFLPFHASATSGAVYVASVSPSSVTPGSTAVYAITLTNQLQTNGGNLNAIHIAQITAPAGFTITSVTPPPYWTYSVSGSAVTFQADATIPGTTTSNPYAIFPGNGVTFLITATAPANVTAVNCVDTTPLTFSILAGQQNLSGGGNSFTGNAPVVNVVPQSCFVQSSLVLNSISPPSVITGSVTTVSFAATLTRTDGQVIPAGETIAFSVAGNAAGTGVTNSAGVAVLNGFNASSLPAGQYAVQATYGGEPLWNPPFTAAASNYLFLTVNGQATNLSAQPVSGNYGTTQTLTATLTASATPLAGKTISFALQGNSAGSAVTDSSGVATLSVLLTSPLTVGNYPNGVLASFAGDGTYAAVNGFADLTISQYSQTIAFGALSDKAFGDPSFAVSATASSGLTVTFSASGNCTVSGNTVTITGAGSCTVTALQPGNAQYAPAPDVPQTFNISKANASLVLSNLTQTYSGSALTPGYSTTPTGLAVTWTGAPDTNTGSYSVTANINDNNYTGSASGTFVINPAAATVTLMSMSQTYNGSPLSPAAVTVPPSLAQTLAWTGTPDTNAGSYPVTATVTDPNYTGSAAGTFVINPAPPVVQAIGGTFPYNGNPEPGSCGVTPNSLTVTPGYSPGSGAPVSVGMYSLTCSVAASANYSAGSAQAAITINAAGVTVTGAPGAATYGSSETLTVAVTGSGETPTGTVQFQFTNGGVTYNICADGSLQAQPAVVSCAVALSGGTSTVTTNNLPAGTTPDQIRASYYSSDTNYNSGANTTINFTVSQAGTQTTLSITPANGATYGDTVTLASAVSDSTSGSTGIPTGTVQFQYTTDGTKWNNIGNTAPLTAGNAQTTTGALPAGALQIRAVYSGDSNFLAGTSGAAAYTVNPKVLTVSGITANNRPYDGTLAAVLNTSGAALAGVVGTDNVTLVVSGATGTFGDPNVGTGKTVTIAGLTLSGGAAPNYTLTPPSAPANITAVSLTITASSPSVTYGDSVPTITPGFSGFVNSESSSVLTTQPSCSTTYTPSANAGNSPSTSCAGAVDPNYSFVYVNGAVTIAKANAAVSVNPYNVTYDGGAHTATGAATGVKGESLSGPDLSGTTHTLAGAYTDAWTFTDSTGNYNNASGTVNDAIAKAQANITVTGYSVTYDGGAHTASGSATGAGGVVLAGLDLSGTTHVNAGNRTDSWTFTDSTGNYANAGGTVTDTIAKASAAIAVAPYNVTYDGTAHTATGTATGVKGESLSGLNLSGTTHTNAGNWTDTWTFTDLTGNYSSTSGTAGDSIARANATITVTGYGVTYDGNAHTATGSATGIGGVALSGLSLAGTSHTNAGSWTDTWTFTDLTGNYNSGSGAANDSIARANAMINVTPYSVIYDGNAHTAAGAATGVNSVSLSGLNLSGTTHTNAGNWTDSWTFADSAGNYNSTSGTVSDSISQATPILGVNGYAGTYDGNPHSASATMTPASCGAIVYTYNTPSGTVPVNAGSYLATASFAGNNNCQPVSGSAPIVINKANAVIKVTAYIVTYDGTAHTAAGVATGVKGESLAGLDLSGTTHINASTYSDSWTFTDQTGNYNNAAGGVTDVINQKAASVIANSATMIYGTAMPTLGGTTSGFLPSDNVVATYSTTATATSPIGQYAIVDPVNGNNLGNYKITETPGTLTIAPRPTTIAYTGTTNGHYGDCGVPLSATLVDTLSGAPLAGERITFTLGTGSTIQTVTAVTSLNGIAVTSIFEGQDVGTASITASFAGDLSVPNYGEGASSNSRTYTVLADTAVGAAPGYALYTGSSFFWTTGSSSSTATLTLSTTLKGASCANGNSSPDIRKATVSFGIRNSDGSVNWISGAQNLGVGLVNPTDVTTGTATAITQWNLGNASVQTLEIVVGIFGDYYHNSTADDKIVTISKPPQANAMVGGGGVDLTSVAYAPANYPLSSGYLATAPQAGPQGYLQISANVQYNKSGTNPQGGVTLLFNSFNKADGSVDTALHTYLIQSSSISELTLQGAGVMSFGSKSVIQDVTNPAAPISVGGGATLEITANSNSQSIAVTVIAKSGTTLLSSAWNGIQTVPKPLVQNTGTIVAK